MFPVLLLPLSQVHTVVSNDAVQWDELPVRVHIPNLNVAIGTIVSVPVHSALKS